MTGKDLILYILENDLENEQVFKDGVFIGFMSDEDAAAKFNVGVETIHVWLYLGIIKGATVNHRTFVFANASDPRKVRKDNET